VWTAPNAVAAWQAERRQALVENAPAWHRTQTVESERDGEWFRAAFHWGWLAQAEPDSGQPHFRRGLALAHLGRTAEAKVELNESIKLHGKGGTTLDYLFLAMAHHQLGQPNEARTWLDKGLRVDASEKTLPDTQRLELQLLRWEAETLIRGPAPPEKK
jgi:tetratricopeptide (TPR) repeat protein